MIAILIVNLRRSTTGLALNAVRWSENASRTMGLSVIQMKMLVSGLAAFVAGVGGGLYAVAHKQAIPLDYVTLAGLVWLAVLVTFGIRSNIAALLGGVAFVMSAAFFTNVLHLSGTWALLPGLGFGLGAIGLAKNPEGVVYTFTRWIQGHIHGGERCPRGPAASGYSGPDDPRLPPPSRHRPVSPRSRPRRSRRREHRRRHHIRCSDRHRQSRHSRPATSPCASVGSSR